MAVFGLELPPLGGGVQDIEERVDCNIEQDRRDRVALRHALLELNALFGHAVRGLHACLCFRQQGQDEPDEGRGDVHSPHRPRQYRPLYVVVRSRQVVRDGVDRLVQVFRVFERVHQRGAARLARAIGYEALLVLVQDLVISDHSGKPASQDARHDFDDCVLQCQWAQVAELIAQLGLLHNEADYRLCLGHLSAGEVEIQLC